MLLRVLLLFVFVLVLARAVWRLLEGVIGGASGRPHPGGRRDPAPPAVKMARCPVCGTYVVPGKALTGVSKGVAVYFCSEACRTRFAA